MPWYLSFALFVLGLCLVFLNIEELQDLKSRSNSSGIKTDYVLNEEQAKIRNLERIAITGLTLMAIGAWPIFKYFLLLMLA